MTDDEERKMIEVINKYEEALAAAEAALENAQEIHDTDAKRIVEARDLIGEAVFRFRAIRECLAYGRYRDALSICHAVLGLNS